MTEPITTAGAPELSVLVPTYGRAQTVERLLDNLNRQSLDPARFEVIVVDDGSPEPIALDAAIRRFTLTLLRQPNAGPGAARNLGLTRCRAPWTLILNDDAVPAEDLLARHLEVLAQAPEKVAVLGTFHFTRRALQSPFVQVLQQSDLLFDFPHLRHGELHGWTFFWTCNLSLPTQALRDAGGFDAERFREPIVEDVELGYRLAKQGWRVLYRSDLVCEHDHVLEPEGYFRRMVRLGVNMARMFEKHRDPALLHVRTEGDLNAAFFQQVQQNVEALHPAQRKVIDRLVALECEQVGRLLPAPNVAQLSILIRQMGTVAYWRGLLVHFEQHDPVAVIESGPRAGRLTSIVVLSYDALEKTRKCVEALRASADPRHPSEWIFVDNGSTDGSAEWLAAQPDIELIRNTQNAGAPRARNQALARVRGDYVVVMDNDAIVTPGWLRRLLQHAETDAKSGCIGPVSNRAAHGQQVPFDGPTDFASLARHADAWAAANECRGKFQNILTSFCLLMRREVLDAVGAFDERFSPWGFEDDDFTLRAALAGFRNRIALDVFVRHEHYDDRAKSARHDELLQRNWRQFAHKWSGSEQVAYGDYKSIERALHEGFGRDRIHLPLARLEDLPALLPDQARALAARSEACSG